MDPAILEIVKAVGPPGVFFVLLWVLHRDALAAFRAELKAEREMNQQNLARFFDKLDHIAQSAICRLPLK